VRFSEYEKQEDWLAVIEGELNYFGGVPKEILIDNAKCIMVGRVAYGEGRHRWNDKATASSKWLRLQACRPYWAKTKGKVERFNGYLKNRFITPLAATLKQAGLALDVDMANVQVGQWLDEVAHQRIYGTTGKTPERLLMKHATWYYTRWAAMLTLTYSKILTVFPILMTTVIDRAD